MSFGRFNANAVDPTTGVVISEPSVEVRRVSDNGLVSLYSDKGTTNIGNPFTAGTDGAIDFYTLNETVNITASKDSFSRTWPDHVIAGTAATADIGTSTGQLPEAENVVLQTEKPSILKGLDKSQWPTISNAADADHDITFSAGSIVDSLGEQVITLSSALTKQIDAAWAAGDAAGGLFFGTVAADTTYHCFLIIKDSDGSVDSGFDTSLSAANIPAGYTAYRRVHSLKTDSASNFQAFDQYGDTIELRSNPLDFNGTAGNSTRNLLTLVSIPGVEGILAKLSLWASIGGASSTWVRDVNFIDQAATVGASDITTSSSATTQSARISVPVDSSSQVARRSNNVSVSLVINSAGYIDQRVL